MGDAKIEGNSINFNGWIKIIVGVITGIIVAGLISIVSKVSANEKGVVKLEAQYEHIITDLNEIKSLLRRTAPYERKDFNN